MDTTESQKDPVSLEDRPGIFMIGSSNVGKRSLLSRLLSVDSEDAFDSASEVNVHGWTINTKYYTADVSVWMAHLHDEFSDRDLPSFRQMAALVMVFDMNDLSSLTALKHWVSQTDIQIFEILLCIGNKMDLVPGHPAHAEYRRRLLKLEDSASDLYSEFEYGISESEGTSLLGDEEPSCDIRRSCLEWCTEHNIEFIEACASNADFDKCLSMDGDLQGVERLYGALSAHMWPGMVLKSGDRISQPSFPRMVLKSGDRISQPSFPEKEELSSEESDYEQEYEVLSAGSADPWDETEQGWISATSLDAGGSAPQDNPSTECEHEDGSKSNKEFQPTTSSTAFQDESDKAVVHNIVDSEGDGMEDEGKYLDLDDLEQLMSEIGNMRAGLRLMPDFQRKEMAAKLAMKMASIFGGESDEEET
ncbi:Small GTPase superfamily [Sesbania bispinosa]|nr:Small GTPase superfamily [Sesbania bispinosa]